MYQRYLKLISFILCFIVVGFFIYNWNDIAAVYYRINIYWAFVGLVFYMINYLFRGIRLKIICLSKINFLNEALHFSIFHGFLSYLLPLRTGDISLPALLKSTGKIDLKKSIGVLVKLRVMDLVMIGLFSSFWAFLTVRNISLTIQIVWLLSGFLLAFSWFFFQKIGWLGNYFIKSKFNYEFDISTLFKFNYREMLVTFFIWICVYASQYCMIKSIGLDLKMSEVVFISAIQFPLQMLPVQGLANSGNHESGWVSALILMGFSMQDALKYAIASHGVLIIYVAFLGLFAFLTSSRNFVPFCKK